VQWEFWFWAEVPSSTSSSFSNRLSELFGQQKTTIYVEVLHVMHSSCWFNSAPHPQEWKQTITAMLAPACRGWDNDQTTQRHSRRLLEEHLLGTLSPEERHDNTIERQLVLVRPCSLVILGASQPSRDAQDSLEGEQIR
jgi:hypothetical protein